MANHFNLILINLLRIHRSTLSFFPLTSSYWINNDLQFPECIQVHKEYTIVSRWFVSVTDFIYFNMKQRYQT